MLENCCWRIVVEPAPERDDEKYFCSCFEVSRERKSLLLYRRHHHACSQLGTFFSTRRLSHIWTGCRRLRSLDTKCMKWMNCTTWCPKLSDCSLSHPILRLCICTMIFLLCCVFLHFYWLAGPVRELSSPTRTEKLFFRLLSLVFGWRNKSWKRDVNQQTCHVILMKDKLKTRNTKLEDSAENDEQSVEESATAWDWHRTIENFFLSTFCATIKAGKTPKTSHETHNTQKQCVGDDEEQRKIYEFEITSKLIYFISMQKEGGEE